MNVLLFNYEYPPLGGGGGVVSEMLATELASRSHRVVVVTSRGDGMPARERIDGVDVIRLPVLRRTSQDVATVASMLSFPPSVWLHLSRYLSLREFDVLATHFAVPTGVASVPLARLAGLPNVVTLMGGDLYKPDERISPHRWASVRWVVRRVLSDADAVIAGSENTRQNARRLFGFDGEVSRIPFAVRKPEVPPASRQDLGLPEGAVLAVTVGRLVPRKGLDGLLRAVGEVDAPEMHLTIMGSGPERENLERLARNLGVADRVRFTGFVPEIQKWQMLEAADLYLSATHHEGFGLVYLEALSSGLPVVTYDFGGQTDFLEDGVTGALVPVNDEDALVRSIKELVCDEQKRRCIAEANRERARKYSAERFADQYEALFENLAHDRD